MVNVIIVAMVARMLTLKYVLTVVMASSSVLRIATLMQAIAVNALSIYGPVMPWGGLLLNKYGASMLIKIVIIALTSTDLAQKAMSTVTGYATITMTRDRAATIAVRGWVNNAPRHLNSTGGTL